jgi:hypothetical protein
MWRTYIILVLIGLLVVSTGGNVLLLRQTLQLQADTDGLRQRAVGAEARQQNLQAQIDQLKSAQAAAAQPTGAQPQSATQRSATAQPQSATAEPPSALSAPLPSISGNSGAADPSVLRQIEYDVAGLRGLRPRANVPLRFLSQDALQRYFVDNFNQDYLPIERETDQKFLQTLGLLNQGDNVVQTLLDVLQEQVIGVYNADDKTMYLVGDQQQFGSAEKDTFAHEFTHALQDQYFGLRTLMPKHPDNDDRALAFQALSEGDAVLIQRLWAQQSLRPDEMTQLDQSGQSSALFSAPLYLRQQLLFPYTDGFNFVRQTYQTGGGYAAVDDIFLHPPESTAQILHPEKYRNHVQPVEVSLPDLSASLGDGWRSINANVLGELDTRLVLEQLTDQTRAVRGSSGWAGDRWQLLEKDGRQALVIKSVWDSDASARAFFDTFGLAMQNRFAGAKQEEVSATRQALTATSGATDVRRDGSNVLVVVSFDRPSADAIVSAVGAP